MHDSRKIILKKDENIVSRNIGDEIILVPIRRKIDDLQSIYTANELGSRIWDLIDGNRSVQEIVDVITSEYDVSAEQAKADIEEYVDQLLVADCVQKVSI